MTRIALGWLLILHGLAHAYSGTWSSGRGAIWPLTILWFLASVAYVATGLGVLRTPVIRHHWKVALVVATASSMLMVIGYLPPWGISGFTTDLALWIATIGAMQPRIDADIDVVDCSGAEAYRHPRWVRIGWSLGSAMLVYMALVLAMRPVSVQWGTTHDDRVAVLPGDEVLPNAATYRIDHAITIHAPASAVWPWLVQLGQDRGGFYSYDWLERAVGDRIRNADHIHPEWQRREVGDTILATQPDYFGGRLGTLGWRVTTVESGRVIGLENWGTFVLEPIDSTTTRLIVRTRGTGDANAGAFLFAPLNVFVFEPMHFIMERGMLRGIRDRAERGSRTG